MSPSRSPAPLVLDPPALQRRATELLAEVDADPRRAAERIAAAEAHVRLVVTGAARDKAARLLDRAIDLDPYRASTYLISALASHREGRLHAALERYEQAAALAPGSVEIRFHCGFGFLDAARSPSLSDEAAAELAEVAGEHFEAALALDPAHVPAALGAIESAIYGKATRLRDALPRVFARVEPAAALLPTMTRLLYQAIFAFKVGKAKGVDQKNKKTMGEVSDVARAWLAVFPEDPGLLGVVGAAAAKCQSAEELCDGLAEHARAIPDVRVLRLILRERLAEVTDPGRRVELFAAAMERIPPLDGIAHDYLQLLHLVAKRAVAEGDLPAAREAWRRCQALDPDNPSTTQNLLRLAVHEGDALDLDALDRQLTELWALYAELSPRADVVLGRAAARAQIGVDADLDRLGENLQKEESRPSAAQITNLLYRWARGEALARLAVEPALFSDGGVRQAKALLQSEPEEAFGAAIEILAQPIRGAPPVAYAYLHVPKDATDEEITRAHERLREGFERNAQEARQAGRDVAPYEQLLDRGLAATRPLLDAAARAAYDASTCATPVAELYRRHAEGFLELARLCLAVAEPDTRPRAALASLLARIPGEIVRPYLPTTLCDEAWLALTMLRVRYGGLIDRGMKLLNDGDSQAALALCRDHLDGARGLARTHFLYAVASLEDEGGTVAEAVERALEHARAAVRLLHWSDAAQIVEAARDLAGAPPERLAQRVAAERAFKDLKKDRTRDALFTLWSAYPGQAKRTPAETPASRAFLQLRPAGTALYAFAVGRSLRENIIAWYNASSPSSQYEHSKIKTAARAITDLAAAWAEHAIDTLRKDPARGEGAEQLVQAVRNLLGALERDRRMLS